MERGIHAAASCLLSKVLALGEKGVSAA